MAFLWPRYLKHPRPLRVRLKDSYRWQDEENLPNHNMLDIERLFGLRDQSMAQMLLWGPWAEATKDVRVRKPAEKEDEDDEFIMDIGPELIAKHIELYLAGESGLTIVWDRREGEQMDRPPVRLADHVAGNPSARAKPPHQQSLLLPIQKSPGSRAERQRAAKAQSAPRRGPYQPRRPAS